MSVKPDYNYTWQEAMNLIGYENATPPEKLRPQRSSIDQLKDITALHFGFGSDELFSKTRRRDITQARHMLRAYMMTKWDLSFAEVARRTGAGDHTTAIHSVQVHKDLMAVDRAYQREYEAYTRKCADFGI